MAIVGGVLLALFLIAGFVALHVLGEQAAVADDEELRQTIASMPPEMQYRLWMAKLRHDADKDLH